MLKPGELTPTRSIRVHFTNPKRKGWGEYKAEKGKYLVFIYLGQEPIDGTKNIDPSEILKKFGWTITSP